MEKSKTQKRIILPIFLPNSGCPNRCVFCNQKETTLTERGMTPIEAGEFVERETAKLSIDKTSRDALFIEAAFYGGSFTAIPKYLRDEYLAAMRHVRENRLLDGIRFSTRPDYVSPEIIDEFTPFENITAELGAQSLNDETLKIINRHHTSADVENAARLLKQSGVNVGIHLMVNLPNEPPKSAIESARKTAALKPDFVRIHPTLVFADTILADWHHKGEFLIWDDETLIETLIKMLEIFEENGIPVVRLGLQRAYKDKKPWNVIAGFDHPALRDFIESRRFGKRIKNTIDSTFDYKEFIKNKTFNVALSVHPDYFSKLIGYEQENKKYLKIKYPQINWIFKSDDSIKKGEISLSVMDN